MKILDINLQNYVFFFFNKANEGSVWHYLLFHIVSTCSQRLALNETCVRCMFESTKYLIFSYSKYFNKYFQYVSNLDLTWPVDQLQLTRLMLLVKQCLHSFEAWLGHHCWYSINTFFSFSVDGSADWRVQTWICPLGLSSSTHLQPGVFGKSEVFPDVWHSQ